MKLIYYKTLFLFNLFLIPQISCSQSSLPSSTADSLWTVWQDEKKPDTSRLNAFQKYIWDGYLQTQPDSAFIFAEMQYEFAKQKGLRKYMARALHTQGISFRRRGEYTEAFNYSSRSLELYEKIGNEKGVASALNNIGHIYAHQSELVKALDYYTRCLQKRELIGDDVDIAISLNTIGTIYYYQSDYNKAIDYFMQSLEISERIGDDLGMSDCLNNIGLSYVDLGNYSEAIDYLSRSLKIKKKKGDVAGVSNNLNNIGILYRNLKNYDKAQVFFSRSLEIYDKTGNKKGVATALNNIGEVNRLQKKYDKAMEFFSKSLAIDEEIGNQEGVAISLMSMGHVYKLEGQRSKAKDCFIQSLEINESIGHKGSTSVGLDAIGRIYKDEGNYSKAMEYSSRAFNLAQEIGSAVAIRDAANTLWQVNKKLGNYKQSLEMYELYAQMNDSIQSEENRNEVVRYEFKYEYDQKKFADSISQLEKDRIAAFEKTELEYENEKLELGKKENRNLAIAGGLFLLLITSGLWTRLRFHKKANAALDEAKTMAERSEAFKQQFLAYVSHEIRTPMNAIMGMTSLVLDTDLNDKQKSYLEKVKISSDMLLHIMNEILDLSKIESGKMELEKINISLSAKLDHVKQTLQYKADKKGLQLIIKFEEGIDDIVLGDPFRLNQVLLNLTNNAIKFTEKGSVILELKRHEDKVRFSVTDTGIGIPQDKIQTIFESFGQANTSDSRKYGGTGLGLSISQQLVELMGGNISVESKLNQGSTFFFDLVFEKGDFESYTNRNAEIRNIDGSILNGLTILLVDDNEYNRIVTRDTLQALANLTILEAESGQEAIDKLNNTVDVILMDAQMPVMNGYEATKEIREKGNSIPIIAFTASVMRSDIDQFKDAGMNGYIPKPFSVQVLIEVIADVMNIELTEDKSASPKKESPFGIVTDRVTDLSYLLEFCDGDKIKIQRYIDMFIKSAPTFLEKLEELTKTQDAEGIAHHVHGYSPMLVMMGMKKAKSLCIEIEDSLRENNAPDQLLNSIANLTRMIEVACNELKP